MKDDTRHRTAFNVYFELGPNRSIELLRDTLSGDAAKYGFRRAPGLRTLYRWSKERRWQLRLAELEEEARERAAVAHAQRNEEMRVRHGKESLFLQHTGIGVLQRSPDGSISPAVAIQAIKEGVRLEREANGDAPLRRDRGNPYRAYTRELSDADLADTTAAAQRALERTRFPQP